MFSSSTLWPVFPRECSRDIGREQQESGVDLGRVVDSDVQRALARALAMDQGELAICLEEDVAVLREPVGLEDEVAIGPPQRGAAVGSASAELADDAACGVGGLEDGQPGTAAGDLPATTAGFRGRRSPAPAGEPQRSDAFDLIQAAVADAEHQGYWLRDRRAGSCFPARAIVKKCGSEHRVFALRARVPGRFVSTGRQ
jgi:hypothetical protein